MSYEPLPGSLGGSAPSRLQGSGAIVKAGLATLGIAAVIYTAWPSINAPVPVTNDRYALLANEIDANIPVGGGFRLDRQSLLAFRGHNWIDGSEESSNDESGVTKHWYNEQIDDHFAAVHEQRLWKQKFFINAGTYKGKNAPVFLYICGEGPCTPGFIGNQRFMHDLAVEQGALLIALEHRFFGHSYPTEDMSVHNLRLLSSRQALEDLARFRVWFAEHNDLGFDVKNSKWVSFGGSYAGGVTAWLKMKYPHLFVGSISSSGPIHAQTWFPEYFDVTARSLKSLRGQKCLDALDVAFKKVHDMLRSDEGVRALEAKFNACEPMTNSNDFSVFESAITGQFADSVQYNHQSKKIPAEQLCDEMTADDDYFGNLHKIVMRKQNGTCMDVKFDGSPRSTIATTSVDTFDGSSGGRQWFWMTCNEFGYFQTAGKKAADWSPFRWLTHMTDEMVASEVCKRVFLTKEEPSVGETNRIYGGRNIRVDNVTFVNGKIDPWYWLGLYDTEKATDTMDVLFIEDGSHCADMRVIPEFDTPSLMAAREKIRQNVDYYLNGRRQDKTSS